MAAFDDFPISYHDGGPLVRLVPFLESDAVFDRMNDGMKSGPGYVSTGSLMPRTPIYLSAVICPGDVGGGTEPRGNYAGTNSDGSWDGMNGLFRWKPVRPADITDGQSRTAAFSEWLTSPHLPYVANQRAATYERRSVAIRAAKSKPSTREAFIQECLAMSYESQPPFSALGLRWTHFGHGHGVYNPVDAEDPELRGRVSYVK